MNINIEVIPHSKQRYQTPGDWYYDGSGDLQIRISKLDNWKYECLVAVHEVVEVVICKHQGVTQEAVDTFDQQFEEARAQGLHPKHAEPGDDPDAPYRAAHAVATACEHLFAAALGVDWRAYSDAVEALLQVPVNA